MQPLPALHILFTGNLCAIYFCIILTKNIRNVVPWQSCTNWFAHAAMRCAS